MFSWFYKRENEKKEVKEINNKESESILHQPIITIDDWSHELLIDIKNRDIDKHEKMEKEKLEKEKLEKEKLEKEKLEKEKMELIARIELNRIEREKIERRYKEHRMECKDKLLQYIDSCISKIVCYLCK